MTRELREESIALASERKAARVWLVSAAGLLAVSVLAMAFGVTPWLAPAASALCLVLAIGQRASWPFAVAAAIIITLAVTALAVRFTPDWGIGLVAGAAAVLAILGSVGLVGFARTARPRLIGARTLRIGLPIAAVPVLVVVAISVKAYLGSDYEWAMRNDAVWNLVTTRVMIEDGGLNAISHPSAAPLTPGLLAIVAAVGRDAVASGDLLRHDAGRFANFWLLAVLVSGLLAALIGARSVHGGARWARLLAAMLTGLLPMSWFFFGFAAQYGFYNAAVSMVLLLATWLAWLETRVAPVLGAAVLSLAGVALLATWAPLAIVPFALAMFALVSRMTALPRGSRRRPGVLLLVAAAAPIPLYVWGVTLPDLAREGAALAVDGGFFDLEPIHALVIATITLAVAILNSVQRHQVHQLNGVVIVVVSALVAAGYLVFQRRETAELWGYYPAKFSWLILSLLLVILASSLASEMVSLNGRVLSAIGTAGVAIAVPVVLMLLVPPTIGRFVSLFAPLAIATNTGFAAGDPAAERLFELAEPGTPTLALFYEDAVVERFVNSWLLQLEAESAEDPIRLYSYILVPQDELQACEAVRAWGRTVRVVTTDPDLPQRFDDICTDADYTVEVVPRAG